MQKKKKDGRVKGVHVNYYTWSENEKGEAVTMLKWLRRETIETWPEWRYFRD